MIMFLLMNLIVCTSAFLLTYRVLRFSNFVDSILSLFILYFAQIVLTELLLGALNILYPGELIMLNMAIFLIILYITRNKDSSHEIVDNNILIKLLGNKVILWSVATILGFGLVKVFINLVNPPFGWDDLNYHFTFPVEWLKHHNLDNPAVVSCDPSPTYYPINGSLFFFWFILPLKSVFIADLGQVPFFILAFLAVYSLAKKMNLSKEYALFSAFMFSLVPNYFKQLEIAYIDILVSALFLAALNYLFLLKREGGMRNVVLYSISLGLMIGTKTIALPYALPLLLLFLYLCFIWFKRPIIPLLVSLAFIIVTGGFSYIRNYIQTGNPLYPLHFEFLGKVFLRGVISNYVYRAHVLAKDYNLTKILFSEGLGAQTLIFFLPAIFLGPVTILLKRKKRPDFHTVYFMFLPVLLILLYRFIIPLPNLRYLYALLGVCSIISFYVARELNIPGLILAILVTICALASAAELASGLELIVSIVFTIGIFLAWPKILKFLSALKKYRQIFIILIVIFLSLLFLEKDYRNYEYQRYVKMTYYSGFWPDAAKAWRWLNQNTQGNNIAYIGRPVPFPLYGSGFKNNVYYVSVNKIEPVKLHYFLHSQYIWGYDGESVHRSFQGKDNYRGRATYDIWIKNLLNRNTDYLFIYSLHQIKAIEFPPEDQWARAHPEIFNLAFKNDIIHIYKIIK